jgi:hypothetical protein
VGITEETDASVIVVSEETGAISVVLGGEMVQNVDPPILRVVLRDILSGEREDLRNLSVGVETGRVKRETDHGATDRESGPVRSAS